MVFRNIGKFLSDDVVSHPTRHAFSTTPLLGTKAVRVMQARGEWSTALCNFNFCTSWTGKVISCRSLYAR
jgi:hypothetical protein